MVTYAERPWTKHYDEHVPPSLEPYPNKVLHDYLTESAKKHQDCSNYDCQITPAGSDGYQSELRRIGSLF